MTKTKSKAFLTFANNMLSHGADADLQSHSDHMPVVYTDMESSAAGPCVH